MVEQRPLVSTDLAALSCARPDQHVAQMLPLDGHQEFPDALAGVLLDAR